jgi:hypothetical protein
VRGYHGDQGPVCHASVVRSSMLVGGGGVLGQHVGLGYQSCSTIVLATRGSHRPRERERELSNVNQARLGELDRGKLLFDWAG